MSCRRSALQADVDAFLAACGQIQVCAKTSHSAHTEACRLTRQQSIEKRKRPDGLAIEVARAFKRGRRS